MFYKKALKYIHVSTALGGFNLVNTYIYIYIYVFPKLKPPKTVLVRIHVYFHMWSYEVWPTVTSYVCTFSTSAWDELFYAYSIQCILYTV